MRFEIAALLLVLWNITVFIVYGIDKHKAKRGAWRISERVLVMIAVLMGAVGALLGMGFFRHKTRHMKFKVGIPLALFLNIAVMFVCVYFAGLVP